MTDNIQYLNNFIKVNLNLSDFWPTCRLFQDGKESGGNLAVNLQFTTNL